MSNKIQEAKDQILVDTATRQFLTALGNNYGVPRPKMDDANDSLYRTLIPLMSFEAKTVVKNLLDVVTAFLGPYWNIYRLSADLPSGSSVVDLPDITGIPSWGKILFTDISNPDSWRDFWSHDPLWLLHSNSLENPDMESLTYYKSGLYTPPISTTQMTIPNNTKKAHGMGSYVIVKGQWDIFQTQANQFTLEIPKSAILLAGILENSTYLHSMDYITTTLAAGVVPGATTFFINPADMGNFPNDPFLMMFDYPTPAQVTTFPILASPFIRHGVRAEAYMVKKVGFPGVCQMVEDSILRPGSPLPANRVWNAEGSPAAITARPLSYFRRKHLTGTMAYYARQKTDYLGDYFCSFKKWVSTPLTIGLRTNYDPLNVAAWGTTPYQFKHYVQIPIGISGIPVSGECVISNGATIDRFLYKREDDPALAAGNAAALRILQPSNLAGHYHTSPLVPAPAPGSGDYWYSDTLRQAYLASTPLYILVPELDFGTASDEAAMGVGGNAIYIHGNISYQDLFDAIDLVRAAGIVVNVDYIGA